MYIFILRSPPRLDELPDDVAHEFTYGGRVDLFHYYYKPKNPEKKSIMVWTEEDVDKLRSDFQNNELYGSYGTDAVQNISHNIDKHMSTSVSWQKLRTQKAI